ncbi:hypothetical protein PP304_gp195 [Gordonia phage Phendrix]|uniref:Uncharacterized protein n=1 Tax=Gordonia phage Phendrix TaxID=2593335 RepID=A0A514U173_9CAUD|nr:hypothetical protein PP304_gp195 [Gordonia phage Phendrix]QDK02675.1 hypothetical protein SEA_PHENDRIX_158 [Gordonia phage Phendrix]
MKYEDAVKKWGAQKLDCYSVKYDEVLDVEFEMDEGYACCGGRDPDCYCSLAEGASLKASIRYRYNRQSYTYTDTYIDMGETIREVVEME